MSIEQYYIDRVQNEMTVGRLRDILAELAETHGDDTPILATTDYGDISHTQQVHFLSGDEIVDTESGALRESAYSGSSLAIHDETEYNPYPDDEPIEESDVEHFTILRIKL